MRAECEGLHTGDHAVLCVLYIHIKRKSAGAVVCAALDNFKHVEEETNSFGAEN